MTHPNRKLILLILVPIAVALGWWQFGQGPETATNQLSASGRIEGRMTTLSAKTGGTVTYIHFDESDKVSKGDLLIVLEDEAFCARADAEINAIAARELDLEALDTQLALAVQETELQIELAKAAKSAADAQLAKAEASFQLAQKNSERSDELQRQKLVSIQTSESNALQATIQKNSIEEARANQIRAEKQYDLARLGKSRITALKASRAAYAQRIEEAKLKRYSTQLNVEDMNISSPISGTILTRNIEVGELLRAGTPVMTLVDMNQLYLKIYVPEVQIGKLVLKQPAKIYVDAFPDQPFEAYVSKIAQQAEFTPKNVETKAERVKLVFAIELAVKQNEQGLLKPGMPADAVIELQAID
ncbi:MAG: HlyD family efflux transporter periplasmic adaptor subunit [Pseudomonadales bacterium]|nr:HlyD family efflux transporter periplasmic adaptor subunit [Pseudomonadales bacterium]